ncbi:MAG: DNA cytosine methyltransferase [Pseudomonadota bacterium]
MGTKKKRGAARLTCVDLFAGAGGLSLAATRAGFKVVAAVEQNKNACLTYRENLIKPRGTTLYENDILKLDPTAVATKHFSGKKECDVVLGGPPCQGFSVHRIKGAGVGDPRNQLILRYFEFVKALKPKVFLMENVPGILWKRHSDFLNEFYAAGELAGYVVKEPVTIDARDFGVPQRRRRVFILGIREDIQLDIDWPPQPTYGDLKPRQKEGGLKRWLKARTVFKKVIKKGDPNDVHMNHSAALIEVFESTPHNGGSRSQSNRILPCHESHDGHTDVYGRIDPAQPAPTMTTACINPSKGRFLHPSKNHGISVRHAARFQTFPDWFVFKGGLISAGEQIGNAVPIKLGAVLLRRIAKGLKQIKD